MRGWNSMDWRASSSQISNTIVGIGFHLRIQTKSGRHAGESPWHRTGHVPSKLCPRRCLHVMHRRLLLVLTSHHGTMTWMMLVMNWSVLIIVVGTLVDMLLLFLHILLLLSLAVIEW